MKQTFKKNEYGKFDYLQSAVEANNPYTSEFKEYDIDKFSIKNRMSESLEVTVNKQYEYFLNAVAVYVSAGNNFTNSLEESVYSFFRQIPDIHQNTTFENGENINEEHVLKMFKELVQQGNNDTDQSMLNKFKENKKVKNILKEIIQNTGPLITTLQALNKKYESVLEDPSFQIDVTTLSGRPNVTLTETDVNYIIETSPSAVNILKYGLLGTIAATSWTYDVESATRWFEPTVEAADTLFPPVGNMITNLTEGAVSPLLTIGAGIPAILNAGFKWIIVNNAIQAASEYQGERWMTAVPKILGRTFAPRFKKDATFIEKIKHGIKNTFVTGGFIITTIAAATMMAGGADSAFMAKQEKIKDTENFLYGKKIEKVSSQIQNEGQLTMTETGEVLISALFAQGKDAEDIKQSPIEHLEKTEAEKLDGQRGFGYLDAIDIVNTSVSDLLNQNDKVTELLNEFLAEIDGSAATGLKGYGKEAHKKLNKIKAMAGFEYKTGENWEEGTKRFISDIYKNKQEAEKVWNIIDNGNKKTSFVPSEDLNSLSVDLVKINSVVYDKIQPRIQYFTQRAKNIRELLKAGKHKEIKYNDLNNLKAEFEGFVKETNFILQSYQKQLEGLFNSTVVGLQQIDKDNAKAGVSYNEIEFNSSLSIPDIHLDADIEHSDYDLKEVALKLKADLQHLKETGEKSGLISVFQTTEVISLAVDVAIDLAGLLTIILIWRQKNSRLKEKIKERIEKLTGKKINTTLEDVLEETEKLGNNLNAGILSEKLGIESNDAPGLAKEITDLVKEYNDGLFTLMNSDGLQEDAQNYSKFAKIIYRIQSSFDLKETDLFPLSFVPKDTEYKNMDEYMTETDVIKTVQKVNNGLAKDWYSLDKGARLIQVPITSTRFKQYQEGMNHLKSEDVLFISKINKLGVYVLEKTPDGLLKSPVGFSANIQNINPYSQYIILECGKEKNYESKKDNIHYYTVSKEEMEMVDGMILTKEGIALLKYSEEKEKEGVKKKLLQKDNFIF